MGAHRTLVGAGLKAKEDFMRPTDSLIPEHLTHIKSNVGTFSPSSNSLTLESGETVRYDYLIVAAGLQISELRVWS
jgi:NADH dehydrogenase FAD-containing subunit